VTAQAIINAWRGRLTLGRAGSMRARGRALAVLATTAGFLAYSGAALAGPAQAQREVLAGVATTSSEADLATTMVATGIPNNWGSVVSFTATVTNKGPDRAVNVVVTDTWTTLSTFTSVIWPFGVASCTTPPHGGRGSIVCKAGSLAPGGVVKLTVNLRAECFHNQFLANTASATSSTPDPNPANNTASGVLRC